MINIKIGIIYYSEDIILHNKVKYIEYIKIKSADEIKFNNKPVLIVGWNLVKNKFNNINILKKKINDLYYWTFSFNEKKTDYIKDINNFVKIDILNVFNAYTVENLSPIFNKDLNTSDDYINYFKECKLNNIYISKLMHLSVLCDDYIFRINLSELKFFKIDYKLILNYLKNNYKNFTYDRNGNIEDLYISYFSELDEIIVKKYIPLFNKVAIYT